MVNKMVESSEYRRGLNDGIRLCINMLSQDLTKLKEQMKDE